MDNNKKIYIYNPSIKTGGTNNLLGNLAMLLANNAAYQVNYIDYEGSPIKKIILNKKCKINFLAIDYKKKIIIENGIIILILLSLKTFNQIIHTKENTRILLWSTHPDDGLKLLPSFNLWLRMPQRVAKILAGIIHPFYKNRISEFLKLGRVSNGVVCMDSVNVNSNKLFYNLDGDLPIIPIFTDNPSIHKKINQEEYKKKYRIVILGRLTNFKVYPLKGLLEQIKIFIDNTNQDIHIDFIGSGPKKELLNQWLVELKIQNYYFKGHIDLSELDAELANYHLLIGMGTSTLEGAKLKIPSLVINAAYEIITTENTKLKWLFDVEENEIGKFVKNSDPDIVGHNINEILKSIDNFKKWEIVGQKCYDFWLLHHSPEAIRKSIDHVLKNNTFYFNKQTKSLLRKDLTSHIIDFFKSQLR